MVQIRRKSGGFTVRTKGVEAEFAGDVVIFEDPANTFAGLALRGLVLKYANLDGYDLRAADFTGAKLRCSTIRNANAESAVFCGADMVNCDLTGCLMSGADFSNAALCFADFSDCDMTGASFCGAHLEFCHYNIRTVWPSDIDPHILGAKRRDS